MQAGFYNPEQILNRDLTIIMLNILKPKLFLDGFGATGVRGIRVSKETQTHAVISERSEKSFKLLTHNVLLNESEAEVHWSSFEEMVTRYDFDFIDVDPYGSIIPYLDISLKNVKNRGYIGFTATDLSALSGALREKTLRRYGSIIPKSLMRHELGIRNLIGTIAKRAAALDLGVEPLLSFWNKHYYRIFVRVVRGAAKADETLKYIGMVDLQELIGKAYSGQIAGPIWIGAMENVFNLKWEEKDTPFVLEKSSNFFHALKNEDISLLFCDVGEIFSKYHMDIPNLKKANDIALNNGATITKRTHFSPTGLKTDYLHAFENVYTSKGLD